MALISDDIYLAKEFLEDGELVAIPTETVYGLAANAFDEIAVKRIFEVKQRPDYNPLIVHIGKQEDVYNLVEKVPAKAKLLMEAFWPGPLTLVLPKKEIVPQVITGKHSTVGVRMPNHALTLNLLNNLDFPLAAPSANMFGKISPTNSDHVEEGLGDLIPMILEGGAAEKGIESTIVGFDGTDNPVLLRHGVISRLMIEKVTGEVTSYTINNEAPEAPGMLTSHYAPNTKCLLVDDLKSAIEAYPNKKIGVLSFRAPYEGDNVVINLVLSTSGDGAEAARNLYAHLHLLDHSNADLLLFEKLPELEISASINDKLKRATA